MSKTIVVLFGLNAEHEIIESQYGIAFATGKLVAQQYVALYVATSKADAQIAIDYYSQEGTLQGFLEAGGQERPNPIQSVEPARLNTKGGKTE